MDKLIKGIPDDHLAVVQAKAELKGCSTSAHIRGLIREDAGVMDLALKGIPYALGAKIQANAKAGGISLNEYIFKLVAEGVHFTG
jgi:hypothetical protein